MSKVKPSICRIHAARYNLQFIHSADEAIVTSKQGVSGPTAFKDFITSLKNLIYPMGADNLHVSVDALFATDDTIACAIAHGVSLTWSRNSEHMKSMILVCIPGLCP
jgi:hypothetical protein